MKKVMFLYSELAGYLFSCFEELANRGLEVKVIHWAVNPEAPFVLPQIKGVEFLSREGLDMRALMDLKETFEPDILLVSGWLDSDYLAVSKRSRKHIPTVILFDTKWNGSIKQRLMSLLGSAFLNRIFSHAWVAGQGQKKYASRLGFKEENIRTGFYTADVAHFKEIYDLRIKSMQTGFSRRIIYVGRYVNQKNIQMLWSAFIKANELTGGQWKLRCIGTGERFEERLIHEDIEHVGFVQPSELSTYLLDAGVFVLPSTFEPWGVVVHEMAAAGFPMILSDQIGASEEFLAEGHNGFSFDSSKETELLEAMQSMMTLEDSELRRFSEESHRLALKLDPSEWASRLLSLL